MDSQDPSRPPGDIQILTQDEEEEILQEDEVKQPKQGDDSLPNMLTSLNDNIAHMAKSFSTLSETLASFTAEKGQKRDSRQLPDPAAKRQKLSPSTSSQVSDSDEDIQELLTTDTNCAVNNGGKQESSNSTASEDKFLDELAHEFDQDEKTTSPIAGKLADIINKRWATKFSDSKFNDRMEKYERPENCDKVLVPRVNQEIWARLSSQAKRNDLRLASVQKVLVKIGAILAQCADKLMTARLEHTNGGKMSNEDMNGLLGLQIDALALLGHANYDLSLRRREVIKPTLNREYGTLCSSQNPVTSLLFGDDLQAQLNAIRASNRLGHTATKSSQGASNQNMKRQRNDRDKPFLSRGYPNTSKWKQQKPAQYNFSYNKKKPPQATERK